MKRAYKVGHYELDVCLSRTGKAGCEYQYKVATFDLLYFVSMEKYKA